jgi:3'-phosphoadenosine 5'-phosphosulfate sulfotransferase (PAPS reductase)/FAD synthetase
MSAERINGRRVVLSVSGGKDSAAASLHLRELGIEHDRVFADTGWEHPKTYEYLRGPLTAALGPIHEVRSEHLFTDLVRSKRIFPDRTKRFCTVILKVEPIGKYIASLDEDVVNVIGVRRAESAARANVAEWEYSKSLDCDVWRPLAAWTIADVIAIHRRHGLAPNPLYAMGATRVCCWPCIHARQSEIIMVANTDPGRIDEIRALESEVTEAARGRADAKGEELDWIRSLFSIRESKKTPGPDGQVRRRHRPMPIDEAIAWARAGRARGDREEAHAGCGEWGFCEAGGDAQLPLPTGSE